MDRRCTPPAFPVAPVALVAFVAAIAAVGLLGGCRAYRYACHGGLACVEDSHCRRGCEPDGEGGYCVNARCADCRLDVHCDEDNRCVGGRCVGPPEGEASTTADDVRDPVGVTVLPDRAEPE